MKSSRKKPWQKVKTAQGIKYKYDFQDLTWGITRTRKTFNTAEEAQDFHDILLKNARNLAKGENIIRPFGEAMAEYLEQNKNGKLSIETDTTDLNTLRWPFNYRETWWRLEDLPLHDKEGGIIWGVKKYLHDLSLVTKRSYINKSLYHLRNDDGIQQWYEQPNPTEGTKPANRKPVTDRHILRRLNEAKGRGPFSKDTLRRRMSLAKTILETAWSEWRWLDNDLSALIKLDKAGKGRISFLTVKQCSDLLENVDPWFSYLIQGGVHIGWRKSNLVGLTWDRVVWPEYVTNEDGERVKMPGYLYIPKRQAINDIDIRDVTQRRIRTKNGEELDTIMTLELECLLRELHRKKHPDSDVVFHNGSGDYWGDFRKRWTTAKKKAGIPNSFRWHDLRHTWATEKINSGIPEHIIMAEQGWKDPEMVRRYGHLQREARAAALKKASNS